MFFLLVPIILFITIFLWLKHLSRDYELTSLTRKIKTVDGSPLENSAAKAYGFWGNNYDLITTNLGNHNKKSYLYHLVLKILKFV